MSANNEKGYIESAIDKTKEIAGDIQDSLKEGYDKMTGNRAEDKAADKVKDAADKCAEKAGECRDKCADKLHEGARKVQGH